MKILFIIHSLYIGGSETVVTEYLINMKQKGYDVSLLQLYDSDTHLYKKLLDNLVPVYSLYKGANGTSLYRKGTNFIKRRFFSLKKMNDAIKKINPDIIHFHTNIDYMNKLHIDFEKVVYTFHTAVWRSLKTSNRFKKTFMDSCKRGMHIVAISNSIKNDAMEFTKSNNISWIPNGIDTESIRLSKIDRDEFCKALSIKSDSFILGQVGRFHPVKNHEKTIDVFCELHKKKNNAVLILVGDGDEERTKTLKEKITQCGLEKNVYFLGMRSDAKAIMSVFDCLILPSLVEGFPLVLGEAQVHGIRCVASSVVPDELLINNNSFKLDIEKDNSVWADYILGQFIEERSNDIETIDINTVIGEHIKLYRKIMEKRYEENRNYYIP